MNALNEIEFPFVALQIVGSIDLFEVSFNGTLNVVSHTLHHLHLLGVGAELTFLQYFIVLLEAHGHHFAVGYDVELLTAADSYACTRRHKREGHDGE